MLDIAVLFKVYSKYIAQKTSKYKSGGAPYWKHQGTVLQDVTFFFN